MQNENKGRNNLSAFAFQRDIEIPGIGCPSGIYAITKLTFGVAF